MLIERLPEEVINRIAAGEVVQSPSAALKELLENALDSGATRVSVTLAEAGLRTMCITDNGTGISESNLPLVATRFATSKLRVAEDLQRIATFGFRGEAVAALSYVAVLRFRTRGQDLAGTAACCEATYRNAALQSTEKVDADSFPFPGSHPSATGTSVTVENLFYNAPTRRAVFSSKKHDEMGRMEEMVRHYAAANPGLAISLVNVETGRPTGPATRVNVPASCANILEVLAVLYGAQFASNMIPIDSKQSGQLVHIDGVVSGPFYGHTRARQFISFVNGRLVTMPSCLRRVCERFYAQILPKRQLPYVFLRVTVPPDALDVNIHPTKSEVRILYEDQACALLEKLLQQEVMERLDQHSVGGMSSPLSANSGSSAVSGLANASPPQKRDRTVKEFGHMERFVVRKSSDEGGEELVSNKRTDTEEKGRNTSKSDATTPNIELSVDANDKIEGKPEEITLNHSENSLDPKIKKNSKDHTLKVKPAADAHAKPVDPSDPYLLDSVKDILTVFDSESSPEISDTIQKATYVGCLVRDNANCSIFLQKGTSLYMLDANCLLTSAAYQRIFWFWEPACWKALEISPPIKLSRIFSEAGCDSLTKILQDNSHMLQTYFGISIEGAECLLTSVSLLFGSLYVPNIAGWVPLLAQIAHVLDADLGEGPTLERIARAIAVWYSYRCDARRMDSVGGTLSLELPAFGNSSFSVDKTTDFAQLQQALQDIAVKSQRHSKSQPEHDFMLHHGVLASIQKAKRYCAPEAVWVKSQGPGSVHGSRILCIATTEALYKVFERC